MAEIKRGRPILDACCGSRMFWFDKENADTVYMDCRELDTELCDGRRLVVSPDVMGDFRDMPFDDGEFRLVVFDPLHALGACYCRECKYRFTDDCATGYESSQGQFQYIIGDNDFCSHGEPKEQEET